MNSKLYITKLINNICQLKEAGVNVIHEERPRELGWRWVNQDTNQTIDFVGLNKVKSLFPLRKTDPRIKYLIAFVVSGDALSAKEAINKLNKLKAFW
jgi:hypothetical protein